MIDWRKQHGEVMTGFVHWLNAKTDNYVLKGGTALYLCYNLDRFSEDIDLDGRIRGLEKLVAEFCEEKGFTFRLAKKTPTVERCMLYYGNMGKPLKIEVSYRRRTIDVAETNIINGILVYKIEPLCIMKVNAYTNRDKIRDLYDVTFISKHYYEALSPQTVALMRSSVEYKGIEHFDYIIREQQDELIDNYKLSEDFLTMFDQLGLLHDNMDIDDQDQGMTMM